MCKLYGNSVCCWLKSIYSIMCKQKQTHVRTHTNQFKSFLYWCNSTIHIISFILFFFYFSNHKKTIKKYLTKIHSHTEQECVCTRTHQAQRRKEMLEATNEIETTKFDLNVCIVDVACCRYCCCFCCYFIGCHKTKNYPLSFVQKV